MRGRLPFFKRLIEVILIKAMPEALSEENFFFVLLVDEPQSMTKKNPFRYFETSPEVIRLAVMMYVRFPLSP